jgi:hypothetical protein
MTEGDFDFDLHVRCLIWSFQVIETTSKHKGYHLQHTYVVSFSRLNLIAWHYLPPFSVHRT